MGNGREVIYLRIPQKIKDDIQRLAKQLNLSMNEVANQIFQAQLDADEQKLNDIERANLITRYLLNGKRR